MSTLTPVAILVPQVLSDLSDVANAGNKVPPGYMNPSFISLKRDMAIPDDATITGIGSSSFSDAGYGSLTLASLVTPIGIRPSETVTQRIQAVLNLAASGPLGIYWDVRCSVGVAASGGSAALTSALWLRRPGNLHIVGRPGCGVILRAQCNSAVLANEMPTFGTPSANIGTNQQISTIGNIQFGNVRIEGLYVNVNSGIQSSFSSAANQTDPAFGQTFYLNGIRLFGAQDVTLTGVSIIGGSGFHLYLGNGQRFRLERCVIDDMDIGALAGGNDCIHINGPFDDLTARDCRLATNDDHFALNTADGQNTTTFESVPNWGSITRVRGYNTKITKRTQGNMIRVMACAGVVNTNHEFAGIDGAVTGFVLLTQSTSAGATSGPIGTVDIRDVDIDFSASGVRTDGGVLTGIERVRLTNIRRSGSHLALPLMSVTPAVAHVDIRDLYVHDDGSSGSNKPQIQVVSGGSIGTFSASGVSLDGNTGSQNMPLLQVASGGSVNLARLSNCGVSNVAALISNAGTLGTLVASNIDTNTAMISGSAAGASTGDYFGSGSGTSSRSVVFDDTFTGTTGSAITGTAGSPTPNGSDTWIAYGGFSAMVYKAGGGVTTTTATAFSGYSLTGVPQDQTITFKFLFVNLATNALTQFHRTTVGTDNLALTFNGLAGVINLAQTVAGTNSTITQPSYTFATGTIYTATITITGTSLSLAMFDGTTTAHPIAGQSIPSGTGTVLLIGQSAGSAGDVVFSEVKVLA